MKIKSVPKTLTLLITFLVLSLALFGCGTTNVQTKSTSPTTSVSEPGTNPQTPADPAVARGLSIYNTQCESCHGTNGSGGGNAPRLIGKTPSSSYIQSNMPRNKPGSLSSGQVSDLVVYITSLK